MECNGEITIMVHTGKQVFEADVYFATLFVTITTPKSKGWKKAHRQIVSEEVAGGIIETYIDHRNDTVTTTWER